MTAGSPLVLGPRTQLLADGLGWAEGPAMSDDGRIFFVETYRSSVSVWGPRSGTRRFAYTAGGPNACVICEDGSLVVCQNGGTTGPWRAEEMVPPSIQWVSADGRSVETVATEVGGIPLRGPNDLVWGPDGILYFTDPGVYRPEDPDPSRIFALHPSGEGSLVVEIDPPSYPNGIAVTSDGQLVWAESYSGNIKRLTGSTVEIVAQLPGDRPVADGLAIADNGDLFVTTVNGGGIEVISPTGEYIGHLECGQIPTNCVFAGDGLLILTDAGTFADSVAPQYRGQLWLLDIGREGDGTWPGSMKGREQRA